MAVSARDVNRRASAHASRVAGTTSRARHQITAVRTGEGQGSQGRARARRLDGPFRSDRARGEGVRAARANDEGRCASSDSGRVRLFLSK